MTSSIVLSFPELNSVDHPLLHDTLLFSFLSDTILSWISSFIYGGFIPDLSSFSNPFNISVPAVLLYSQLYTLCLVLM